MNPSTNASESSRDGSSRRRSLVTVNAGDAIASVASALIAYVLHPINDMDEFLGWYRDQTQDDSVTESDLINDLTSVRETLKDMGYEWP